MKPFTLTLLGTDTSFTPNKTDDRTYPHGESLSMVSTCVRAGKAHNGYSRKTKPTTPSAIQYKNEGVVVVKGPDTHGDTVGNRIAHGVLECLEAISRGQTRIVIMAHSRGAVQALLVAHELQRIQVAMRTDANKALLEILCESNIGLVPQAFNAMHYYTDEANNANQAKHAFQERMPSLQVDVAQHIGQVRVALLGFDPVPGNQVTRWFDAAGIHWNAKEMHHVPEIVDDYQLLICENEYTNGFAPAIPEEPTHTGMQYRVFRVPGHHGTASGNRYDQQYRDGSMVDEKGLIQQLGLVKLIYFLRTHGVELSEPDSDSSLTQNINTWRNCDLQQFPAITLELYESIATIKKKFAYYENTNYFLLGQWRVNEHRAVLTADNNYQALNKILPELPEVFVNKEHAILVMHAKLGFTAVIDNESLAAIIMTLSAALAQVLDHDPTAAGSDAMTTSTRTSKIQELLVTETGKQVLFKTLSALLASIGEHYRRHTLSGEQKQALLSAILKLFSVLDKAKITLQRNVADDSNKVNASDDATATTTTTTTTTTTVAQPQGSDDLKTAHAGAIQAAAHDFRGLLIQQLQDVLLGECQRLIPLVQLCGRYVIDKVPLDALTPTTHATGEATPVAATAGAAAAATTTTTTAPTATTTTTTDADSPAATAATAPGHQPSTLPAEMIPRRFEAGDDYTLLITKMKLLYSDISGMAFGIKQLQAQIENLKSPELLQQLDHINAYRTQLIVFAAKLTLQAYNARKNTEHPLDVRQEAAFLLDNCTHKAEQHFVNNVIAQAFTLGVENLQEAGRAKATVDTFTRLTEELKGHKRTINMLRRENTTQKRTIQRQKVSLSTNKEDIASHKKALAAVTTINARLQEDLTAKNRELEHHAHTIAQKDRQLTHYRINYETMRTQMQSAQQATRAQKEHHDREIATLKQEAQETRAQTRLFVTNIGTKHEQQCKKIIDEALLPAVLKYIGAVGDQNYDDNSNKANNIFILIDILTTLGDMNTWLPSVRIKNLYSYITNHEIKISYFPQLHWNTFHGTLAKLLTKKLNKQPLNLQIADLPDVTGDTLAAAAAAAAAPETTPLTTATAAAATQGVFGQQPGVSVNNTRLTWSSVLPRVSPPNTATASGGGSAAGAAGASAAAATAATATTTTTTVTSAGATRADRLAPNAKSNATAPRQ